MAHAAAQQISHRQPKIGRVSGRPPDATWRLAWRSLTLPGLPVKCALLAFVNFWNIPVLGAEETDTRYFRTRNFS